MALFNVRSLSNKSFIINDFTTSLNLDFLLLTETWSRKDDQTPLIEACPPDYKFINVPRESGRGGGIAAIHKNHFKCSSVTADQFSTFEVLMFMIYGYNDPVLCVVVYRPPKPINGFLTEFSELLSSLVLNHDKIIIAGDFNLHIDVFSNLHASEFLNLTESFNFVQHVSGPTHNHGHTLDLIFTHGLSLNNLITKDTSVSDHFCLAFDVTLPTIHKVEKCIFRSRIINSHTASKFSSAFISSSENVLHTSLTDEMLVRFNGVCRTTLDAIAPLKTRLKPAVKMSPWINDNIRSLKRDCRKIERQWKSTKLQVYYLQMKESLSSYNLAIKDARAKYFSNLITVNQHNPRFLFNTIDRLVNPAPGGASASSPGDCEKFL